MLLSLRKNGLTSLFKEVRVFKVIGFFRSHDSSGILKRGSAIACFTKTGSAPTPWETEKLIRVVRPAVCKTKLARNLRRKNVPNLPKFLNMLASSFWWAKKLRKIPAQFPATFPFKKIKEISPTSFCRRAG